MGDVVARMRAWVSVRHSLPVEAGLVVVLYALYETARGIVVGDTDAAERHADRLVALERSLHVFAEGGVQRAAHAVPGLPGLLSLAYLTLHLTVTIAVLLWLHQRSPAAFASVRTTLLVASGIALIGFLAFPTAPPRLADVGIADTVSNGRVDLNHGLVSALYNPYAAVPSMHVAYALVVSAAVIRLTRRRVVRVLAALYTPFVLFVIVATGNHFFFDAATGAAVAAVAAMIVLRLRVTPARLVAVPAEPEPVAAERLAA
jgi:PAP2 superfamily